MEGFSEFGKVYLREKQFDKAVENFKSALEQARKLYPGQSLVADILNNLGGAVQENGNLDESLRYLQEAKEILDHNDIDVGNLTLGVLNNIGASYSKLRKSLLAFQSFKDALDRLDMTIISSKLYKTRCWNMANIVTTLSVGSISKTVPFFLTTELKTVGKDGGISILLTKDTCPDVVSTFFQLSLTCQNHGVHDEVLIHSEKAREIVQRFHYKCGRVVLVLLLLSMTYGWMGSIEKSRLYYKEAKEMAKNLPLEDNSILPGELGMIESMKKEC